MKQRERSILGRQGDETKVDSKNLERPKSMRDLLEKLEAPKLSPAGQAELVKYVMRLLKRVSVRR